ncbi:MAG: hypothetical protein EHM55_13480 [Acidobacteria bacterium]|nr:MAG: hypothetical protein EHM55_13480 [Acidobacteriota bacterium]
MLGSLFWVFGRATLGGIALTIVMLSVWAGLRTLAFGVCAAVLNIVLLRRRCTVPSLAPLPLW